MIDYRLPLSNWTVAPKATMIQVQLPCRPDQNPFVSRHVVKAASTVHEAHRPNPADSATNFKIENIIPRTYGIEQHGEQQHQPPAVVCRFVHRLHRGWWMSSWERFNCKVPVN